MLTTSERLITPLVLGLCLCINYFGLGNVEITYEFGLMIMVLWPADYMNLGLCHTVSINLISA